MLPPQSVLFTGACRSGKSALAQAWCERRPGIKVYVATAEIRDAEMADRAVRHQAARGGEWLTVEVGRRQLAGILRDLPRGAGAAMVDCTTLWLAGLMEQGLDDGRILELTDELAALIPSLGIPLALVHNETGWGLVPEYPLGRRFRDLSGLVWQKLAAACDAAILAVCGLPLILKGKPD
jgi:adenosylcobinamide kinase/adenosylcobinamide-phosphate guanylyltransferase